MLAVIADSKISVASHDINFSHNVHCGHSSCDFKIIEVSNSFLGSNNLRMDIRESMKIIAGNLGEESLEIWRVRGSRCLHGQWHENLGHRVCREIPEVRRGCGGECGHQDRTLGLLQTCPMCLTNHSCEYKYVVIPISPPRKSWNLGGT